MAESHQKREVRRSRHQSVWIIFDDELARHECQMLDISQNGAKLIGDVKLPVGSAFRLATSPGADKLRECKVVWRRGRMMGINFVQ
jgi:ribosomal protein L36